MITRNQSLAWAGERLARREGGHAPTSAVRLGLSSNMGNTRAAALKAAREHADPELVAELIQLVDDCDPYAPMALNALAHTREPAAHDKVLAVASDEAADRRLRERALALLVVTRDLRAVEMLTALANSSDPTYHRLSTEVLRVITNN